MNANRGCRVTAWREGSETGPKLNLSMSKQFCVRDAMGESVFLGTVPNVQIPSNPSVVHFLTQRLFVTPPLAPSPLSFSG